MVPSTSPPRWHPVWHPGHPCPICGRADFTTGKGWGGHKMQCMRRQRLAAATAAEASAEDAGGIEPLKLVWTSEL